MIEDERQKLKELESDSTAVTAVTGGVVDLCAYCDGACSDRFDCQWPELEAYDLENDHRRATS